MNAMSRPIVIAYHLIWTVYGSRLPNDPRGSMSHTVRRDLLKDLGELHHGRKKVQPVSGEIKTFYVSASAKLEHQAPTFDAGQITCVADAFGRTIADAKYTCYACAIMADHVHVLLRKHRDDAEMMIANLQRESQLLLKDRKHRAIDHPVWAGHGWKVFLDHPDEVRRTIGYIEANPDSYRMPRQRWSFVTEYDGWPLHPGHGPNSPYAKRLRGRK